jgi:hypothetical protein
MNFGPDSKGGTRQIVDQLAPEPIRRRSIVYTVR